jgi:L-amino acid N-acyltransferase YncA
MTPAARSVTLREMDLVVRTATPGDAPAIAAIHNAGIEERIATFETRPRSPGDVRAALDEMPFLVATSGERVVGWASIAPFSSKHYYSGVGEASVYVARGVRGRGVGRALLEALAAAARERGFWKLIGLLFASNDASAALCRRAGFREVGVFERHGELEGEWLDVVIVERLLP